MSESTEYKNHTIKLIPDQDCESPVDKYNNALGESVIVCLWQRNSILSSLNPFETLESAKSYASKNGYAIFPIRGYIHSGVAYTVKNVDQYPFNCPWDSGFAGLILLKRFDFPQRKKADKNKRLEVAESTMQIISSWCNGDCYGYVVEDESGEEVDSCWGYIGESDAMESAKYSVDSLAA